MLECAVALLLLVDVSGSVSTSNYKLQQQGIYEAFQDATVQQAIESQPGGVTVSIVEWGYGSKVVVNWRILKTKQDAEDFARASLDTTRSQFPLPTTAIADSINTGIKHLNNTPCIPARRVIDVSGDGVDNQSIAKIKDVREIAEQSDITINGLPIESNDDDVVSYYTEQVITSNGFIVKAVNFKDFGRAIRKKIALEIS